MDDVLPLAIAQKFRERLEEQKTAKVSTSNEEADKRKQRGKKVDQKNLKGLTPRQKEAMQELGFGAMLHYNIKEIPGYIAYWVLKSFNHARCQIPLCGGGSLTLDEEDVHLTLGFPRGPTPISRPVD